MANRVGPDVIVFYQLAGVLQRQILADMIPANALNIDKMNGRPLAVEVELPRHSP